MKIAFAGTPRFGALVLGALIRSRHEIVLVMTQPDRPAGRGRELRMSPVKELALQEGLRVEQPQSISSPEIIRLLHELGAQALTVAAFGQILKQILLDAIPCINVHGSLLPKYRGAAPVERAIMNGEQETGVSIMEITFKLDTGPVYLTRKVTIEAEDDAGAIYRKLGRAGGEALVETLDLMEAGELVAQPQDDSQATYVEKITQEDRMIDWTRDSAQISAQVRALSPHIGAYTMANGQRLKMWRVKPVPPPAAATGNEPSAAPGGVIIDGERLLVGTGSGLIEILEIQPEGKRRMVAAEFLRGYRWLIDGKTLV